MITKYTTEEEAKLKGLIARTKEDISVLHITRSTSCIACYAAYDHKEMIGFIVAWKSKIHPFCTYFRCIIISNQNALVKSLMKQVESGLNKSDYPLQTVVDGKSLLVDYYSNHLKLVRKTYLPTINLSEIPHRYSLEEIEMIVSLDKVPSNSPIVKKLTSLVKQIYEDTHRVNPVAELNLSYWENMIFAEDLIKEGSYIYLDDNEEVLAYSLLHRSECDDTVELGWKGSSSASEEHKITLLVEMQMEYAKQNGFHSMEGEFDDTDIYAMGVLNHFTFPKKSVLLTFQKQKKDENI